MAKAKKDSAPEGQDVEQVIAETPAEQKPAKNSKSKKSEKPASEEAATGSTPVSEQEKPAKKKSTPKAKKTTSEDGQDDKQQVSKAVKLAQERRQQNIERRNSEKLREERVGENQQFFAGLSGLQEACKSKRILDGNVIAIETLPVPGSIKRSVIMLTVMYLDKYKVMIPFEEFFRDNPIDQKTVDTSSAEGYAMLNRRQMQMAEKMYDAHIYFMITHIEVGRTKGDYKIAGSRSLALDAMEARNFIGVRGAEPRFQEGSRVDADILSVGNFNMRVCVQGVDATIPLRDVTYRYVTNLATMYQAGGTIPVMIDKVERRSRDGRVELTVNAKTLELDAAREAQDNGVITVGTVTLGTITSIRASKTKANKIVIHAYLPYFKMPAIIKAMDPKAMAVQPKAGDKMRLRVTGFTEQGFVITSCHGYHNASALFGRS